MKKTIFVCLFLFLIIMFSFADDVRFIWSTARPTVEGVTTRVIPKSSVKAEFFRSWDEYPYISYSERNAYDRGSYAKMSEGLASMGLGYRQWVNWLKSNQNLVFAQAFQGNMTISFLTRNWVYEINFNVHRVGSSTNNRELRRNYEAFIDDLLGDI